MKQTRPLLKRRPYDFTKAIKDALENKPINPDPDEAAREFIVNHLRLKDPLDRDWKD